jgi:hypothetical protein
MPSALMAWSGGVSLCICLSIDSLIISPREDVFRALKRTELELVYSTNADEIPILRMRIHQKER